MSLVDILTLPENLYWAWGKVRRFYHSMDAWYDEAAVAEFESNLDTELQLIREQFLARSYRMSPIRPLPQPKRRDDQNRVKTRQAFWISVQDQVAWLAYVNVIGARLEAEMPVWSYGNRLFRPVWFDNSSSDHESFHAGPYRNSAGILYRRFQQSWPLYRRHIYLAVRKMSLKKYRDQVKLTQSEERVSAAEDRMLPGQRLSYLKDDYWHNTVRSPYWVSLDLEKFYPNLRLSRIGEIIRNYTADLGELAGPLLDGLLTFPLDSEGWTTEELEEIGLQGRPQTFEMLPTGLMAAGFLANTAMLPIDREVNALNKKKQVAHFRYVDDHVVLAQSFESLVDWVSNYEQILTRHRLGAIFNSEKFDPPEFGSYFKQKKKTTSAPRESENVAAKCRLDPRYPVPLMTKTLEKISEIGTTDFDLLDDRERETTLHDLEHLLLAPLPETELPAHTRVTFAATKLARIGASQQQSVGDIVFLERRKVALEGRIQGIVRQFKDTSPNSPLRAQLRKDISGLRRELDQLTGQRLSLVSVKGTQEKRSRERVFSLLVKAVREHPEKLRLWERVLEFCRLTGHDRLQPLLEELTRLAASNALATRVLRARILQVLSSQIVKSALVACRDNHFHRDRTIALGYFKTILQTAQRLFVDPDQKFYEVASVHVLQAAAGVALLYLETKCDELLVPKEELRKELRRIRKLSTAVRAVSWSAIDPTWVRNTGRSWGAWVWWADERTNSLTASQPGPAWLEGARLLNPRSSSTWTVWGKYPAYLPLRARRALLKGILPSANAGVNNRMLLDALASMKDEELKAVKVPKLIRAVALLRQGESNQLNLWEWAAWTQRQAEDQPFDPRLGEWTALQIVCKVLENSKPTEETRPLHWADVLVPQRWVTDTSEPTWEQWKMIVAEGQVVRGRRAAIEGAWMFPQWANPPIDDSEFTRVQEAGLLLLGLLRRSFVWPAVWYALSQQASWAGLVRNLVQELQCSSWTTAILESCLMPRQRESYLFFATTLFEALAGDDDTTKDPPRIFTLVQLVRHLRRSIRVLEDNQITVQNHKPRQLIPVRIEQISRDEWAVYKPETFEFVDDDQ